MYIYVFMYSQIIFLCITYILNPFRIWIWTPNSSPNLKHLAIWQRQRQLWRILPCHRRRRWRCGGARLCDGWRQRGQLNLHRACDGENGLKDEGIWPTGTKWASTRSKWSYKLYNYTIPLSTITGRKFYFVKLTLRMRIWKEEWFFLNWMCHFGGSKMEDKSKRWVEPTSCE